MNNNNPTTRRFTMRVQLNRKGRVSLPLFTATLALAIALILSCSSLNDGGGGDGDGSGGGSGGGGDFYDEIKEYVKYYDPDDGERCVKGVVEWKCGDVWYNPLKQWCYEIDYDNNTHIPTYALGEWKTCGSKHYNTFDERCQGGVVEEKCETVDGDKWYNSETHYCANVGSDPATYKSIYEVKAMERCGSKYYNPNYKGGYYVCQNGVVGRMCGDNDNAIFYNDETHYCNDGWDDDDTYTGVYTVKAMERCGKEYIEPGSQRCNKNGVVEGRCWNYSDDTYTDWYNDITQSCNRDTGEVKDKKKCQ
jgi:hypothetical protein